MDKLVGDNIPDLLVLKRLLTLLSGLLLKKPFGPTFRNIKLSQVDPKTDELLNKVMLICHK
jgi:hypothetical protein